MFVLAALALSACLAPAYAGAAAKTPTAAAKTTPATPANKAGASPFGEVLGGSGAKAGGTATTNTATTNTATTPPNGAAEAETEAAATKTGSEPRNSKSTIVLGIIVALGLLLGIAYVIVRDARQVAPASEADEEELDARLAHERAQALRKRRAKAKAARMQRKRTRTR